METDSRPPWGRVGALRRRSEGADIAFEVNVGGAEGEGGAAERLEVFTTRPDTLFGVTYLVVAPEHPLVPRLASDPARRAEVDAYVAAAATKSDLERTELQKTKTGVHTGATATHPATGEAVPVLVADYVLGSYGSGAVMAVPAHDDRDLEFARALDLPVRTVVGPAGGEAAPAADLEEAFTAAGVCVNSAAADGGLSLNGLATPEAKAEVCRWLEATGRGARKVNYKLRDWLFARQRYWGEPFPVVYRPDAPDEPIPLREEDLPLRLPDVESYRPTGTGESPLAGVGEWVATSVPGSSPPEPAVRDTNTMPQWAGSCWYYLRFLDPQNSEVSHETGLARAGRTVDRLPSPSYTGRPPPPAPPRPAEGRP